MLINKNIIILPIVLMSLNINAEYLMKQPVKKGIDFNIEKEYTEISPGVFEVVLINGEGVKTTFRLESIPEPYYAFTCPLGTQYEEGVYANHSQAIELSSKMNAPVYTPLNSYLGGSTKTPNKESTEGKIYYVDGSGNTNHYKARLVTYYSSIGHSPVVINVGNSNTVLRNTSLGYSTATANWGANNMVAVDNINNPVYRACVKQ